MMNLFSTVLGGMEGDRKGTSLDRFIVGEVQLFFALYLLIFPFLLYSLLS